MSASVQPFLPVEDDGDRRGCHFAQSDVDQESAVVADIVLLAAPDDVHRVTAAMFTISYSCAVIVPVLSGLIWDLSGIPASAFVPIALCGVALIALAPAIGQIKPHGS